MNKFHKVVRTSNITSGDVFMKDSMDFFVNSTSNNTTVPTFSLELMLYQPSAAWTNFMLIFNCGLPYILIINCYLYIMYKVNKISLPPEQPSETFELMSNEQRNRNIHSRLCANTHETRTTNETTRTKRILRTTIMVTVIYGVCWTPSILYYILMDICTHCFPLHFKCSEYERYVAFCVKYVEFLNSVATPSIYCFQHAEFRESLELLIRRLKSTMRKQHEIENDSSENSNNTIM